ncbi:hypothetical protein MMC28_006634 [Mycoblastus sanguinarius]|nr:hypothetical protein [Mycoblastus sanguinarius]
MKKEALLDCDERLDVFIFTDDSYPGVSQEPFNINVASAVDAPEEHTTRCNLMWGLKTLPINLIATQSLEGVHFTEEYGGENLYNGNCGGRMALPYNQSESESQVATQKRRILSIPVNETSLLNLTDSDNTQYELVIDFTGNQLSQVGFFWAVLEYLLYYGQQDIDESIYAPFTFSSVQLLAWFFSGSYTIPGQRFQFKTWHMISIVEAIARNCVAQNTYKELIWSFYADGKLAADGCVTRPDASREWCKGLRPLNNAKDLRRGLIRQHRKTNASKGDSLRISMHKAIIV